MEPERGPFAHSGRVSAEERRHRPDSHAGSHNKACTGAAETDDPGVMAPEPSPGVRVDRELRTRDVFAWLVAPLSYEQFRRDYYQQQACLIERDEPDYFRQLLTVRDLDTVLCAHRPDPAEINLVRAREDLPKTRYLSGSGRIDSFAVAREFDNGATVIFQQLHHRVAALSRLCVALGHFFGSRMQTNIYLTPPNSQGFDPHWDTHDVFVLQVLGRKKWFTYGSQIALPLRGQSFERGSLGPLSVKSAFECGPGSVIYIPRGEIHSAVAMDESSLHITLGMTAFTWADFFLEGVAAAALDDRTLREHLPIGSTDHSGAPVARDAEVAERLQKVLSGFDAERLWKLFEDRVSRDNAALPSDVLRSRVCPDTLREESEVQWRWGVQVSVVEFSNRAELHFAGLTMSVPERLKAAAAFVGATPRFKVRNLPDCLPSTEKLLFADRMIREGLLEQARVGERSVGGGP